MKKSLSTLTKALVFTFLLSAGFNLGTPTHSEAGFLQDLVTAKCKADPFCQSPSSSNSEMPTYETCIKSAKGIPSFIKLCNKAYSKINADKAAGDAARLTAKKRDLRHRYEGVLKNSREKQRITVEEQRRNYNRTQIRPGYTNGPVVNRNVSTLPLAGKSISSRYLKK